MKNIYQLVIITIVLDHMYFNNYSPPPPYNYKYGKTYTMHN